MRKCYILGIIILGCPLYSFSQPRVVVDPEQFTLRLPYGADEEEVINVSNLSDQEMWVVAEAGPEEIGRRLNLVIWTDFIQNDFSLSNLLITLNGLPALQRRVFLNSSAPESLQVALASAHLLILPHQDAAPPDTFASIGQLWSGVLEEFCAQGGYIVALESEGNIAELLHSARIMDLEILARGRDFSCVVVDNSPLGAGVRDYITLGSTSLHRLRGDGWAVSESRDPQGAHISARRAGRGGVVYFGSEWRVYNPAMKRLLENALMWYTGGRSWLVTSLDTLQLPPQESADLFFRVDARAVEEPGVYNRDLYLKTNIEGDSLIRVPIEFTVTPWRAVNLEAVPPRFFIITPRDTSLVLRLVNRGEGYLRARLRLSDPNQRWLQLNRWEITLPGRLEERLLLRIYADSTEEELNGNALQLTYFNPDPALLEVPILYYKGSQLGSVGGRVEEADSHNPVARAEIWLDGLSTFTNEEGEFLLQGVPRGNYRLEVKHQEYMPYVSRWFSVAEGETSWVNAQLLWSSVEVQLNMPQVVQLPYQGSAIFQGVIINRGNGSFSYSTTPLDSLPVAIYGVWEKVREYRWGGGGRANLMGLVFDGENFWVSGLSSPDQIPYIWLFNEDGVALDSFPQPVAYPLGMSDLTWDGRLIWGSDFGQLIGVNRRGEVEGRIRIPIRYGRGVAYSSLDSTFFITETRGPLYQINRNGEIVREIERPDRECYGLAYDDTRRDGFTLYLHQFYGPTGSQIIRLNPHNGEWIWEKNISREEREFPAGCETSYLLKERSSVLMVQMSGGSGRGLFYHISPLGYWMALEPPNGEVPAQGERLVRLTVSTLGMREGERRAGGLILMGHQRGGPDTITVQLEVLPLESKRTPEKSLPYSPLLIHIYPVPFNHTFKIFYQVPEGLPFRIGLYDIQGRLVKRLMQSKGTGHVEEQGFSVGDIASGLYFITLATEHQKKAVKVLYLP